MRVILGYLLQEAVQYRFRYDKALNECWVTEIREYNPLEPIRGGTLYVAHENVAWGSRIEMENSVPILLSEEHAAGLPAVFSPIVPEDNGDSRVVVQQIRDAFRQMENWNLALYQAACGGSSLAELLTIAGSMTQNHIYVADMSFKVLAYTDRPYMSEMSATWRYQITHDYLPVHVMKGLIENGEFEKLDGYRSAAHHYSKSFYVPFATRNVFYKNRPQAHIFVVDMVQRPSFKDLVLAQTLGDFLEQNYHILSKYKIDHIGSNFETFFNDVLSGGCTEESVIDNQIGLLGWKTTDRYGVAIINVQGRDEGLWNTVMYEIESKTKWMCFHHEGDLVVVSDIEQATDSYRPMLRELAERYNVQICIGLPYTGFLALGRQYSFLQEIRALVQRVMAESAPLYIDVRDYAFIYLMEQIRISPIQRALLSEDAAALQAHDAANGTEYFPTMLVFLLHDRNLVKTANALHVHRNTLVYRLERIRELIHIDEENVAQRLRLLLSLLVLQMEEPGANILYDSYK